MYLADLPKFAGVGSRCVRTIVGAFALLLLAACGGGGGSGNSGGSNAVISGGVNNPTWTQNSFASSSTYAARCAAPRSGIDPSTGAAYADKSGSTTFENFWLRSWTHELYLWYSEVVDRNPASYSSTSAYFDVLKTTAVTSTGKDKDQFHFTYSTDDWIALSQSGVSAGYGAEWVIVSGNDGVPPRDVRVAYTEPNSPAVTAGLTRGVKVLKVDGVDLVNDGTSSGVATLNEGLWPSATGQAHTFVVQELNGTQHTVSMTSASITSTPVQNVKTLSSGAVGYILFNDHIATAESLLIDAFTQLKNANVSDLVLDIRYNGGGYLALASEVAYMIAGSAATSNKTFERLVFNDQYPTTTNPVTGGANTPTPFYSTSNFSSSSTALPTLNLSRVFVLTGASTCSASESIINGLRGIGVQVIQIGSTTCGKPYGFYPQDNCGTTYFSIQFKGVNEQGFGDYPDGFSPANTVSSPGELVQGCSVADDYSHALGDSSEGRLAAALSYRTSPTCPTPSGAAGHTQIQSYEGVQDGILPKGPWRENRIMQR